MTKVEVKRRRGHLTGRTVRADDRFERLADWLVVVVVAEVRGMQEMRWQEGGHGYRMSRTGGEWVEQGSRVMQIAAGGTGERVMHEGSALVARL